MAVLQITCLGDCQIALDGAAPNAVLTEKARSLLIYLTLEAQVHQRSDLTKMLWSGYSDESARNSLRQVLHLLRQSLPETDTPWLLVTRQTVQINPAAPITVDVTTFIGLLAAVTTHAHADLATCTTCVAGLRQAVDLYRGDFLAGLGAIDSDGFEEWRRITQEQLHIQMLDALARLANAAESVGDTEGALQAAQRQLALEPWLETAHRQIMRLLAQRGQRAAALAQYQRCRQVLAEELSSDPEEETTALYEQIRSGEFDKVTRRQSDKVTSTSSVTESPNHPVTQSPLHPPVAPFPERIKAAATSAQLLPLLGRTEELAQMTTLLAQPTCRLVTLVGPPGVGKTRLAQEILDSPTDLGTLDVLKSKIQNLKFEQGIHFVDLAVLRDPTLLATTIAHALSLSAPALQLTGERLTEQLRDQALLLVLDNFEQVLPGVDLLRQLLTHCPQIKFLITSRVPLRLPGEQVVPIHPLPLPAPTAPKGHPPHGAVALATAAQNVAVQLFCQRAAAVAPGFVLTERLVPVVVEICRRLDGLPLAIELAAARCRLLPPPALLERLTQDLPARLELLTYRSPTLPERQQTLRAAIAWSYDLLTATEQRLFRQMAVFVGGAPLAALEAVIRHDRTADEPPPPRAIFDDIEALLDKSLLRQQESATHQPEGEPRLLMLETLREYGWELLTATAEGRSTQQRHADYFLILAETAAPKLHGPQQVVWLDRLALDHDNLRAALDWLVQAGEVTKALRLATALRYFWRVRGHYREGGERLRQILARPEAALTSSPSDTLLATVRARALNAAGYLQWVQGNTVAAQNLLQEALTLGRAVPDAAATAFALRYLGLAANARQEQTTARQFLEESLALYRTLDTPNETALALMYLGDIAFGQQAYAEAEQLYQESADLLQRLGNNVVLPYALRHLGYLALVRGDLPTALTLSTESLSLNLAAGEQQGSAAALAALAAVAVAGEQWVQAARLLASVDAWLTTSRAQLLPIDRTYYQQTQQRLQQHRQGNPLDALVDEAARLSLEQALAYVQQELTFAEEPRGQGDKVTSDRVTSDKVTSDKVTNSPSHLVTLSPPHNLPSFTTPLVGRDQALAELAARWQQPGVRLLTLVGPGGMGKTRLAVAAGEARLAAFADGVWFVPLASISTVDALPGAIATALGITLQGSEPRQALLQSLSAQHLLLILDNYEHLLVEEAAVDLVVDLLARAPGVQILITSRQRLNLRGEQLYSVQALTFSSTLTLAEATSASAVRLFVQAVQRVQADFQLTAINLPAVLRICQLVQGMPLGLELAAANAGSAPLRAIADALEQSAEILAVEWRDLPARQRSMRAVFAWSWPLLSAAEQRVLRQSACFRGGFDYTAAQAVIDATPALLTALVNKSLLQWQAGAPGEGRYAMHELLRQFAAEALAESGERAVVEERHGRYYLAYLAARGFRLGRGEPKEASAEIQVELDNVRLAWHWAATQGGLAELDQALYAWWQFCLLQGLGGEAQQSLAVALAGVRTHLTRQADDAPLRLLGTRLLAKLLALHANYLFAQGRDEEMAAQAREAMQLGANSGGFEGEILGSYVLGRVLQDAHQKREAQALWEQTIQLVQRYQPQQPENELLHELHWMAHIMLRGSALHFGDYVGCRAHIVEALRICQTLGKQRGELTCLSCLGEINFFLYDFAAAEADFRAELALGRSLGYRLSEMSAQEGLARVARLHGDYATARTLLEQSLSTATELAFHYDEALFLAALIRLHCQLGDQTAAAACQDRLTQLLAQVQLGKECRLYGYLAAAFKAHYAGDKDEALAAAEQANQINQQGGDILFRLVDTALILGHVRAAAGQWEAAQSAFQEALTTFQQFSNHALSAEPQAGLAQVALAQGDWVGALAQIEALLPVLAQEPHAGYNDPFFIYLTGYRVLVANGDPRAATLLQQGYDLLQQDAAALDDESRQRFLGVPLHRDLIVAYTEMQAENDKVTRWQGDKVTSRVPPVREVTQSLPHLVTQSPLHNLPAELTPFVGRTRSIAEILNRLQQGVRLLTLVGPGGMGKTRLALAIGQQLLATYPDGVWFVALAALTNPAAIATAIATALRLPITGADARTALAQLLQPKRLLLILDNFEQLLAGSTQGVELVAALLQAAPGVQMLVTSRERLQLRSEQLYQVPPLSVAPNATLAEATAASAARLFVQSAQLVQADFQLTPTNLAAVLRICELVQGIPLGLELAAAQVGTLSLAAIGDAIAHSAEFLAVDWVDMPARQRSMRAVFAWSWHLLTPEEQRALRQISIFRGGFDRAAAQAVTSATPPLLTRLLHKSLLQRQETQERGSLWDGHSEARYLMHELLRQFAAEELNRAGEDVQVAAQHGQYYLAYLAARSHRLGRGEPKEASAEIQAEVDNVRLAWQWATTHGLAELEQAVYAWWQFCQFQGLEAEGRQSFAAAIAGVRAQEASARVAEDGAAVALVQRLLAKLLAIHANFLYVQGRNEEMAAQAREAIALGRSSGDLAAETFGVFVLGRSAQEVGQRQEADALWWQTIELVQRYQPIQPENEFLHDAHWMALNALRANAIGFGDYAGSRAYLSQALQLCQGLGKRQGELLSLSRLAQTDFLLYEFAAAEAGWRAALDLARTLGYRRVEMLAQEGLGGVCRLSGDYATARRLLEQAVTIATELAAPYEEVAISATLIRLHTQLGDQAAAAHRYEQLTQILARVKLIKECQLYYHLAAAIKAHGAGANREALRHAEQANQLIERGDILFRVADTALILGHTRAAVGQWEAADAAFHQALTVFQQFADDGNTLGRARALAAEAQAGLAQIALAQGDLTGAQAQIEELLPILAAPGEQPSRPGYNDPFFIYLTAYRVLAATGDVRAVPLLQQGYDLLQQDAAKLDAESRQRFLTAVPLHCDLVAAYQAMRGQRDQETGDRRQETGDKKTRRQEDRRQEDTRQETADRKQQTEDDLVSRVSLSPLYDWAEMPMVDFFVERKAEVAQLTAWLTPTAAGGASAQLISILGMGGMGKTTLAAFVTKTVAPSFAVVIWRSLLNAPPVSELLHNWLQVLSRQSLTTLPESLDEQLRLLLTYLQQARCLLVLDNVESIFVADTPAAAGTSQPQSRAGVVRPGYEGYDQLFQRLASSDHQSCLLLTSREQPYALLRLATGRRGQAQPAARLQVLPLAGLDQMAGQALLVSNGLHAAAAEIAQLVENYSGNPLALQIVAATIADFFGGDVAAFQQEEGQLFDGMRLVLDQQFARLSPLEREILIWLAIEREPITVPMLRSNFIQSVATAPLLEALQALQNRSLLEKRDSGLTLQNVIIEYSTEYVVAQVCEEILDFGFWILDSSVDDSHATVQNPKSKIQNLCLNRFALLKAQAKEYVRQSQARLILQPVAQQLLNRLGQAGLLTRVQEVLALLRTHAPHTPGYAAGNLLNLLLALGIDLTDYDFSNLCVWQPYLREKTLPQFNFINADLRGAAFTDTFDIVRALAYSPDGRWLAAGTSDGEIRLWRATDGQLLANVKGHGDIVGWLCFLDDGKTLISYSHDLALAMWQVSAEGSDAAAGEAEGVVTLRLRYRNNELTNLTNLVAFHPQNELLAFGTERGWLCLWHLGAKRQLSEQTINVGQIHTLHFSPDGKTLALGASDRRIHLWAVDASTGRLVLRQSLAEMPAIARDLSFRADGRTLASGHEDGAIYLWALDAAGDCATGQAVQVLSGHRAGVWRVVFSPDGQVLASASDDQSVRLWAIGGGPTAVSAQPLARFDDHRGWVRALAFSPDGRALASAGADRAIRVWDLRRSQLLYTLYGYVKAVKSIAFCPNSRRLVSGSDDQRVRLWSVLDGGALQTWAGHTSFIWQVAVSPDGRMVASAGDDHQIYVRDASNGQVFKILSGHDSGATAVAFSPDSKLLVSGGIDCRVIMWDVQEHSGRSTPIRTWDGGTQVVWTVAFSPNGEYLVFGGEPNRVRLWHLPTQRFLPSLENETGVLRSLAFSPDSRWLAAGGHDAIVYLWQMGSAAPPILLRGHQNRIRSVAFSPDGRRLATASFDQTVRLWDLQTQSQIRTLWGHSNQVLAVTFSTDGALLASASEDETIRLWDGKTGEPLSVLPMPGPYIGMKIDGVTGISAAQKAALRALGAVEDDKVTNDKVPSTSSVTELPNHLVTQSPPHPVTLPPLLDCAEMPLVDFFVERRAEVAQLTAWLTPTAAGGVPAQLISILGMGGMGKTTLAAAVTKAVAPNFAVVIWRSLLNAPPLNELLRNWLQVLSRQTLTALPESLDEQLRLLLTYLQQERCLLVLDNVESIFAAETATPEGTAQSQSRAGVTRPGYEGYDQLFQRLANGDHQSCLLLTSREQPYALLRSGRQAQTTGRLQVLPLAGLDQTAGQVLLASNGLNTSAAEAAQLVENYSGNPLALQIVAATIADFFGGDVAAFQQEEGNLFDGLRLVLDQQFARLSPLERDILVWLAIEREAITVPMLRSNFVQPHPGTRTAPLLEALQALQNRSLLEQRDAGFALQNVIIEYTTEYLVEQVCQEIYELQKASPLATSFLNRFALIKAQAKQYVRQSQARLILQPVADRLVTRLGRAQLVARLPQLLDALRAAGVQKGYAGGNLLNLLVYLGEELIGYDFSHLPVWQADLSGLTFVNADFTGADLGHSTFTAGIIVDSVAFQPTGELWVAGLENGVLGLWRTVEGQLTDAFQHRGNLRGPLVFSPNGQLLATDADDYRIRIWSTSNGECLQTLDVHQSTLYTLAFNNDGTRLASCSSGRLVRLWDLHTGRCVQRLGGYDQGADALAFSPDGQLLATGGGDGLIQLWDTRSTAETGRRVAAWQAHRQPLGALAFSPDGRWLASGSHAGEIQLWEIAPIAAEQSQESTGEAVAARHYRAGPICQGHTSIVRVLRFVPTADLAVYLLASASADRTVRIWSLTGQLRYTLLGHTNALHSLSVSPNGQQLASTGNDKQIVLWDVTTGQAIHSQQAYRSALHCLAFSPDGQTLACGGADHIVRLWSVDQDAHPPFAAMEATESSVVQPLVEGSQIRHFLQGHTHFLCSVAFSPDGQTIASSDADRTIRLWNRATGQALQTLREHRGSVRTLAFAPAPSLLPQGAALLASAGADRIIRLWAVSTQQRREMRGWRQLVGHEDEILTLAFDQHGRHLVSGCADGSIGIWDVQRAVMLHQLTGHTAPVTTIAIHPTDNIIASSSFDQTIRLWDLTTGACLQVERGAQIGTDALAFSPDGQYIAYTGNDFAIYLWPWRTTVAPILPPTPLRGHMGSVNALSFSPTAACLASCSDDGTIRLWDVESKSCRQILRPPGPYAGMKITGVTGISDAQKVSLKALGAVDEEEDDKETSDRVTSRPEAGAYGERSVTQSPNHLVTQSPPHPVTSPPLLDWAEMPRVDFFVERRAEMAQLTAWLIPAASGRVPAQLISILGMGGMGKTTLAAAVTKAVAANFAVIIWRSLLNAPPLHELVRNWLQILSRQTLTTPPDALDEQLRLLLTYLQQERCLLVLDNVESIFAADGPIPEGTPQSQRRAGVTRPGYEGYDQLLQRLATGDHQSCLLLTSREQPYALLRAGRQAQTAGRIQVLPLAGLDQQAGQALLQNNGLRAPAAEAAQLVENYSGNPLALQIVAATITDFFGGDVAAFQQEEGQFFDGLRLVLDQQFARLSALERDILVWLAIEREPVTVSTLRSNFIQPVATAPLLEALQALQNRSLLEKRDSGLTLQNVLIEYATEYLVQQVCQEIVEDMVTESPSLPWQGHPVTPSFFNRFALLKAQSKEYTRQSQERLILQPVAAHLRRHWEQRSVRLQVQQMLNELREKGTRRGYAAGNLLNLLIHWGVELNGYDFSGLSVWQADLRRSTVQSVNLAQADLSYSAFTQTFSRIECVAISPDGQLLAAAGDGGAIRLFRLPNGEPHHLLSGHTNTITAVAFSPDGAYLVSTGDDGLILLWTIPDGRLHRQLNEQVPMRVVVFSPDGRLLAGASRNGTVLLWQVESGHLRRTLPLHRQRVNALAFHPAGNLLASASSDGAIALVEVSKVLSDANAQSAAFAAVDESQQGRLSVRALVAESEARFFAATFSPDGKRLVVGGADGKLHVWDAPFDQRTSQTLAHQGEIRAVAFCADSRFLFSAGNDGVIRLWDSTDMHCCQTLTGHKETVYALALGLQDRLMASGSEDASICLWEVNPQTQSILRQRMAGYPQALECVAWSGCGRWLATGNIHGVVRLWDLHAETPRCTQEIRGKSTVIALTFTPDGQQLAIGRYADPAGIELWGGRADDQWQLRSGYRIPTAGIACFSPNGSLLATSTPGGDIHLWNAQTLQPRAGTSRLTGHSSYVNRVAFTAEDQLVASCSNDLTVRLWHLATGEEILRLPSYGNNTCLALNAQGTLLACSSPNFGIALWHLADRTVKQPLHNLIGHTNEAFACAFSPDGNHLVSVSLDRSVRLWDVETGAQRTLLGYHEQYALDVAFSPDGKQVATIGKEGALHLWQIDTYECLHQLYAPGPYAGMNITGVAGISDAQKAALKALGAVEE